MWTKMAGDFLLIWIQTLLIGNIGKENPNYCG